MQEDVAGDKPPVYKLYVIEIVPVKDSLAAGRGLYQSMAGLEARCRDKQELLFYLRSLCEIERYQKAQPYAPAESGMLQQICLISHYLRCPDQACALMLSLATRCQALLKYRSSAVYYLLAIVHIASEAYLQPTSLEDIINKGMGPKSNLIDAADVDRAKSHVIQSVNYQISQYTVLDFVNVYATFAELDERHLHLIRYMCFQLMADGRSYQYKPSNLAAACISQFMKSQNQVEWNQMLQFWFYKSTEDFAKERNFLAQLMNAVQSEGEKSRGNILYRIFSAARYFGVSHIKMNVETQ